MTLIKGQRVKGNDNAPDSKVRGAIGTVIVPEYLDSAFIEFDSPFSGHNGNNEINSMRGWYVNEKYLTVLHNEHVEAAPTAKQSFKVGDVVESAIADGLQLTYDDFKGKAVITNIWEDMSTTVKMLSDQALEFGGAEGNFWSVRLSRIKFAEPRKAGEFKAGDKVRFIKDYAPHAWIGDEFVVVDVSVQENLLHLPRTNEKGSFAAFAYRVELVTPTEERIPDTAPESDPTDDEFKAAVPAAVQAPEWAQPFAANRPSSITIPNTLNEDDKDEVWEVFSSLLTTGGARHKGETPEQIMHGLIEARKILNRQ